MSFILDALRKSENERQRNRAPGIAVVGTGRRADARRFWLPLVALLVGVNLSLLAILWLTGNRSAPATSDPIVLPTADRGAAALPPAATAIAMAERRSLADELEPPPPRPRAARTAAAPAPSAQPGTTAAARPERILPTLTELQLAGSLNLRPLNLDLHVYSQQPGNRFVFINSARYREGDTLNEGPTVETITESGVVLSYQGREFLLARE